jgi:predicted nucleotidyltransferase
MALNLGQVRQRQVEVEQLGVQYGARNIRVFGSAARGQEKPVRQVDILAKFDRGRSLFDLIGFKQNLEEPLACAVDFVPEGALRPDPDHDILPANHGLHRPRGVSDSWRTG